MKMKCWVKLLVMFVAVTGLYATPAKAGSSVTLAKTDGTSVTISMEKLMEMPVTEFYTSTPWTSGIQKFRGVDFKLLLDTAGIDADTVRVSALNDYSVMVPANVLRTDGAILAYHMNDAEMSVREKGPFWVVFPYDKDVRFQTDAYWAYSVWQVKAIDGQN
ncbi:molybdopterin-dependent oxidoreductase [Thalassospira lohafexi]|uniref:Oxidoreductase molybdopterin-binding domain-containing protein n=1 Tax=Thalassospira lohafexi TaxID=744227 RepID=A0A2N3L884_9PROT|nr:molybdopterin-dependent oxidoreductase [Thalassospira lohafexi]PKR59019.1 hypothetical protein COO92_09295 [Thalassospira lohafexi]